MIDPDILEIAESGIRLCLDKYPDAPEQAYEAFVQRFDRSPDATRAMLSLLGSLLHERISGQAVFVPLSNCAADPSPNSPAVTRTCTQTHDAGEPNSAPISRDNAQTTIGVEPSSEATAMADPLKNFASEPSSPASRLTQHHASIAGEPTAPAPSRQTSSEVGLARERPARHNIVTQRNVPPQAVNPPRVSLVALAAANQRLAKSLLDTWMVGGRKFGDCRVQEVLDACDNRDRTTHLMRAVIRGMPPDRVIREGITAEGAQERYMGALADLQGVTIDATQPGGYRHVQ